MWFQPPHSLKEVQSCVERSIIQVVWPPASLWSCLRKLPTAMSWLDSVCCSSHARLRYRKGGGLSKVDATSLSLVSDSERCSIDMAGQ